MVLPIVDANIDSRKIISVSLNRREINFSCLEVSNMTVVPFVENFFDEPNSDMRRRVVGVVNFRPLFRVERAAVVANTDDNLFVLDDNTHVDEMFFAVAEAVIDDIARHLFDTNSREHAATFVNAVVCAKILRTFGQARNFSFVRDGYIKSTVFGNVEVFGQQQIIFKPKSYSSAVVTSSSTGRTTTAPPFRNAASRAKPAAQ